MRNIYRVIHSGASINIPTKCFPFFTSSPTLVICSLFVVVGILTGVRWHLIVVLTCIFLIIYDAEHLFACSLATYHLWKNILRFPAHCVVVFVQSPSHIWLFATLWTAALQAFLSFTVSQGLLKFIFIESVMLSNHPLLPSPPFTFNLFQCQGLFQWVGSSHQVAKVLELQLQHQFFQ